MWKSIGGEIKEFFFPARCFFCKKYGCLLCDDCKSLMDISPAHRPDREKKYLADIWSACPYENKFVQKMIRSFKYEPLYHELAIPLAELVAGHFELAAQNFNMENFRIVPVPLAKKRLRWRGFNQAEAIANRLGHIWQLPVSSNCLSRGRETGVQAELTQYQRQKNIKGAFYCLGNAPFKGKSIFLVDDVVTTGATMNECAKILLKNGARQVIGISIARTENS
jgi:ComF family protein